MNIIIVIGNLGRDPEMRYTSNGQAVTSFSLASSRKYTTGAVFAGCGRGRSARPQ